MFGGRGGRSQSYTFQQGGDYDDLLGGLFGGGRFGQPSGGYRGFGGPTEDATSPRRPRSTSSPRPRASRSPCRPPRASPITVNIPAGVADGQKIKLRGKGTRRPTAASPATSCSPSRCASTGVRARRPQPPRQRARDLRRGDLGATIQVPHPRRRSRQAARRARAPERPRAAGQGSRRATSKGTGDLLAVVQVAVPSHLSKEAEDKLREFATQLPDENPRRPAHEGRAPG